MATIRAFTTIEQSHNLAEILPLESADMYYDRGGLPSLIDKYVTHESIKNDKYHHLIPCWTLTSLLSVLPQCITKYIKSESCQKTFRLNLFRSYYHCVSYSFAPSISDNDGNNTLYCIGRDNWVDACVAMIELLHELKML